MDGNLYPGDNTEIKCSLEYLVNFIFHVIYHGSWYHLMHGMKTKAFLFIFSEVRFFFSFSFLVLDTITLFC